MTDTIAGAFLIAAGLLSILAVLAVLLAVTIANLRCSHRDVVRHLNDRSEP